MTDRKPHLSPSQLSLLARCGEAYRRRYEEGEILPPGVAILRGKGVHSAAEFNFRQKIETHEDRPPAEIVEAAVASVESAIAREGLLLSEEESGKSLRAIIGSTKDVAAKLALFHAIEQAPEYQPAKVEAPVRILLPDLPRDLFGYLDVLTVDGVVSDFKTANRSKRQNDADVDLALTFYAAAVQITTGKPAKEVRLDVIVDGSSGPRRQVLASDRSRSDFAVLAARTTNALRVIESGSYTPALPGSWYCSPKFCGYWSSCPFVNSDRIDAAKQSAKKKES